MTGQHIQSARIDVYAAGTTTVQATYQLTDLLVSSVATSGDSEQVSLRFSRIAITVRRRHHLFRLPVQRSC